ncbi:MAG: outer membrane beta-barrel protein [Prevotella sp.]|nr:outer membrane beta-barrel protein [Prevotella sp.]
MLSLATATAKEHDHPVFGVVFDSFTEDGLPALVTLMTADSVVIDTMTAIPSDYAYRDYPRAADYGFKIQKVGRYIVKATFDGYEDAFMDFELRSQREQDIRVKPIRMMKAFHNLPEVTVRATKIKMVMRGDTIVYNADAFNLAEGSMLDALVSRLPGARLTKDGEIFVNGKKIESLLVNGRDFFSGSPKVALQNLPAYTVGKIKVYDEARAASRIMKRDMGDKRYVMDVNLKKEYSKTYLGSAEAGYGTSDRYLAKVFGMKMSDKEWVMGSVNVNNLSDNQKIGFDYASNGFDWTPQRAVDGLMTNREAVLDYNRFFDDKRNWLGVAVTLNHSNHDNESRTNTQTYLPEGDSFQEQQNRSTSKSTWLEGSLSHHLEKGGIFNMSDFRLRYTRNKSLSHSHQTTSDSTSLLNEMLSHGSYENETLHPSFSFQGGAKIIADMLRWNLNADYDRFTADRFSLNDIQYTNGQTPRDFRNTYHDSGHQQWNIKANTKYEICWPDKKITPEYEYNYRYNKTSNMLYRLDRLAGRDSTIWDMLPSAREALIDVLDRPNSYDFHEYQNHHRFKLQLASGQEYAAEKKRFVEFVRLTLPLHLAHQNLYYNRLGRHDVRRHAVFFEPDLRVKGHISGLSWTLNARMWSDIPDMTTLVDYRDDSNPLHIRLGNPDLRNQHYYSASLNLNRWFDKHRQQYWMNIGYTKRDNAVAYATEFDKTTGISTVRPVSVNGNWSTNASLGHSRSLDKADKVNIDAQLEYDYNHNVDMAMLSGMAESQRSIVNNHQFSGNVKLNYRPNDNYEFTLHGGGTYYLVNSRREGFDPIHAGDYEVGFNTTLNLPAKFQFSTDLSLSASRGYQHEEMNKTDWIWNAQLTRSFLKGKLIAKLKCYDILQQIENTTYKMNAQGRTESWHNGIPRYVMLSLAYKFNVTPKKNSGN